MEEKQQPDKKFKIGAVSMALWKREVNGRYGNRLVYACTFERSYKDKDGKWQQSKSFFANDLPKLRLVIDKAYDELMTNNGLIAEEESEAE